MKTVVLYCKGCAAKGAAAGRGACMQLDFFNTLKRLAAVQDVQALCVAPPFAELQGFDFGLRNALDPHFDWTDFAEVLLQNIPQYTLLQATDTFGVRYLLFRLPGQEKTFYVVGPWTRGEQLAERKEWTRKNFSKEAAAATDEYYNNMCRMNEAEESNLTGYVLALIEALDWERRFCVERQMEYLPLNFRPERSYFERQSFQQEIPYTMLEQRYETENAMLDCVAHGDEAGCFAQLQRMKRYGYHGRFTKGLYSLKNKMVIFNTLLRKAIERSQVHPYYIDRISAHYAGLIEHMTEQEEKQLNEAMVKDYCAYVRRYSLKNYSPLIRKVINQINLEMCSDLSLKALAALCHVSPSYLSTLFKQEIGTTLTEFVNTQRMGRAAELLVSDERSISAIAEQVGILDVNYFTKMFKANYGLTPSQYRKKHRAQSGV